MANIEIIELSLDWLDEIVSDENDSFPPALRASRDLIERRFGLGHIMLGAMVNGKLAGKICFSYTQFAQGDFETFPRTFAEFSSRPTDSNHNCTFIYNLNVQSSYRHLPVARRLIAAMCARAKQAGTSFIIFDGPPVSYAGSEAESIPPNSEFRAAIDLFLAGGPFPTDRELCLDPLLTLYYRLGGRFLWIIPGFIPEDSSTRGLRVIMTKEL